MTASIVLTAKKIMTPAGANLFRDGDDGQDKLLCVKCFRDGGYKQKQNQTVKNHVATGTSTASSKFGGGGLKCYSCTKTVYAAEVIAYEKKSFHGECFKCMNCSKQLQTAGAEAKKTGEEIEVYCRKCWGDLGLNRAAVSSPSPAADPGAADSEA